MGFKYYGMECNYFQICCRCINCPRSDSKFAKKYRKAEFVDLASYVEERVPLSTKPGGLYCTRELQIQLVKSMGSEVITYGGEEGVVLDDMKKGHHVIEYGDMSEFTKAKAASLLWVSFVFKPLTPLHLHL